MLPQTIASRLDRLPISRFHRKIFVLVAIGMFFEGFDIYLAAGVLGATFNPSFTVPFHKQLKGRDNSPACDGVALHVPYWQLSAEYC